MGIKNKISIINSFQNIRNRIISIRFFTLVFMMCFIFDLYLKDFRANVQIMGEKANVAILPFLQSNNYFMKLVFLGIIYFYSNVPFTEREQMFAFVRLGKQRWGRRNLSYIAGSAFILTVLLAIISIAGALPVGRFSLSWDAAYKTIALTSGEDMSFYISYHIMRNFEPLPLFMIIFFLDWMVIMIFGMLMYAVSLFGYRTAACVIGAVIVFLPSIEKWTFISLVYYSPISWLDCENWRIGLDSTKPDLVYIFVAGIFLIFILSTICQSRVRRMEWKVIDE